ncbi:cyclin-dependent kinase inhibitor 1C-like, partial [Notothenia coriiceps]|uniref:Cyclin-dependent kinase inhibitor 1C-like n=1 Tax=Notothenia coriiceps TaxID=8208 RepID=A0A6I9PDD5_9TELE
MGPADPLEQEILDFSFSLAHCSDLWRGASRVQQREVAQAEARRITIKKPALVKFLPAWFLDYLTVCFPDPDRPRSPNSLFDTTRIGVVRLESAPASSPVFALVQEPFDGTRLAFGGPRSLQTAPKGRSRKARLAAQAQRAIVPEPVQPPAAMVTEPVQPPAALVTEPVQPPAAMVLAPEPVSAAMDSAPEPAHTAMFPAPVPDLTAMFPASEPDLTAMIQASVPVPSAM